VHPLEFRPARPEDAPALSRLLGQLGYPTDAAEIPRRLDKMALRPGTTVIVAEEAGQVIGCVTVHLFYSLHTSEPTAWLTAVVVDETARGRGVGTEMVKRAEVWAIQNGALRISLTSALRRTEAHDFYKQHGYEHTGVRLAKIFANVLTQSAGKSDDTAHKSAHSK
jgi:N-acetylglutamate synthase-like GNAT family acetyltransferase